MTRGDYIVRKVLFALLTLVVVIITNFFLFRVLPGDPVRMLIHEPRMTREAQEAIRANFGLDKPVWLDVERLREGDWTTAFDTQFFVYVRNLLHGNLGVSFHNRRPVSELLAERVWRTVILLIGGQVLAVVPGIIFGLLAAWRRGTRLDAVLLLWAPGVACLPAA